MLRNDSRSYTAAAWCFWIALTIIVGVKAAGGDTRTVSVNYRQAAQHWVAGEPLYRDDGQGFLYLPTAAILYAPLLPLPYGAGELLWRCFAVGMFAWGVRQLASLIEPEKPGETVRVDPFGLLTLVSLPIAWSAARNGQSTLPMAGLMMLAAADIAARRWNRSALLMAAAFAIKPLALVMLLLAAAVHRPLRLRCGVGLALVLAAPFLFQRPEYVAGQYADCLAMLRTASDFGLQPRWAQVFSMLKIAGADVPAGVQTALRAAAAFGTLALAFLAVRRWPSARAAAWMFGLAALYLVLFNPRTENNTYCLAAPAVGLLLAEVWIVERRPRMAAVVGLLAVGILGSYELGKFFTPPEQSVWLAPLAASAVAAIVVRRLLAAPRPPQTLSTTEPLRLAA